MVTFRLPSACRGRTAVRIQDLCMGRIIGKLVNLEKCKMNGRNDLYNPTRNRANSVLQIAVLLFSIRKLARVRGSRVNEPRRIHATLSVHKF